MTETHGSPDFESLYAELRSIASSYLAAEPHHTLQPTALVHEAYLRFARAGDGRYRDRAHFRAAASQAMRQILVDHARRKGADKRGAQGRPVTIDVQQLSALDAGADLLAFNEALERLSALDERKAKVVELRVFGGLTIEEVSAVVGVSDVTVSMDWRFARSWFSKEFHPE